MTVKTRFAPSPTGSLHIGGVRTALFSWLYARHHGGEFYLRVEDTDRERSTDEAIQIILDGMAWLKLDHDGEITYQTQRFDHYREIIEMLLQNGHAYRCNCSRERLEELRARAMANGQKPRYDGHCRSLSVTDENSVIRFKNPVAGDVIVEDEIQGRVVFQNSELDDLIIARSDGTPTYNLTVVVDDMDMGITHVIRGDDHLNNTPRQINILKALGADVPRYAHIPMILGPDGKKLSKRDGAASVLQYRDDGYLPDALLNYLVRLGWSHADEEIFSREQMVELFDIKDVNKSAASINPEKLVWLNQHYLKHANSEALVAPLQAQLQDMNVNTENGPDIVALIDVQKQRTETVRQMAEQSACFFQDFDEFDAKAAKKHLRPVVLEPMQKLYDELEGLADWQNEPIKQTVEAVANEFELNMGKLGQPLRVAVTGTGVSPNIDDTVRLMGKDNTLKRMKKALEFIQMRAAS